MKFKGRKGILIVILIMLVIATVLIINNINKDKSYNEIKEEFVEQLNDGTRVNTSTKLKETKLFDGLEIKVNEVKEKDNVTLLLGTITNNTNEVKGDYPISIQVLDKQGNEIIVVGGYIGTIAPEETTQLNCSATFDYANAYDINITKK